MVRPVEIENSWLRVGLLPEVGGKIYDLIWKPTGRNWLWHNPRIAPHPYAIEGHFDNHWCGGWDDAFPTCDDCTWRGEAYSALGELRSLEWMVDSIDARSIQMSALGPINPVRACKIVSLAADSPVLQMSFTLTNVGCRDWTRWTSHISRRRACNLLRGKGRTKGVPAPAHRNASLLPGYRMLHSSTLRPSCATGTWLLPSQFLVSTLPFAQV
jgi:hypothetical protein